MTVHGVLAHGERPGHLPVAQPLRDKGEHLTLARRQHRPRLGERADAPLYAQPLQDHLGPTAVLGCLVPGPNGHERVGELHADSG